MSTALMWFRRDLRLHDHPALHAARDGADRLVCVFCFDDGLLGGRHASGPRTQFMLECLHDLDTGLRARGSRLTNILGRGTISNIPNPPRTAVLPSLKGSQAKPKRGAKFLSVGLL